MRTFSKLLAATVAAATLGAAGLAEARDARTHVMTVRGPSGEVVHVRYVGDTPPVVTFVPRDAASIRSVHDPFFARDPVFADFDRVFAAMNARMDRLMREAEAMALTSPRDLQAIGAGGSGFCMRSVRVTRVPGREPDVEERSYGNCGGAPVQRETAPTRQTARASEAPIHT